MPLTNTLETARRIESLGFSHQQAQGFAELFEETVQATQQDLKNFIREQLGGMEGRINVRFAEQESRFEHSLRTQMATILTAIIGVVGLAVAIIKLFPNAS